MIVRRQCLKFEFRVDTGAEYHASAEHEGHLRAPMPGHVLDVRADRGGDVRDQGPRRGRPHEQVEVPVRRHGIDQQADALEALPGRDTVLLTIRAPGQRNQPYLKLYLHPEHARDLLRAQQGPQGAAQSPARLEPMDAARWAELVQKTGLVL